MKMNNLFRNAALLLALGSVGFLLSCGEDEEPVAAPLASFNAEVDGLAVTFTNNSTGEGNTYAWDFGDGNTSTEMSPTNTYADGGTFTVSLTATNDGGSDTFTQDVTVQAPEAPFDGGLVVNGDFEAADAGPWFFSGDNSEVVTEGDNSYFQTETTGEGNVFDVNLSQVIDMTEGTVYTMTFKARTTGDARTVIAGIGLNEDPWTAVIDDAVELTADWQDYSFDFTATFTNANSRVIFDLNGAAGVVAIDDVTLNAN